MKYLRKMKHLEFEELVEGVSYMCMRYDDTIVSLTFWDYFMKNTHTGEELDWTTIRNVLCTEESFIDYISL